MLEKRRNFTARTKAAEYEAARGLCRACWSTVVAVNAGEYDHIIPTSVGGDNSLVNCKLLCRPCHSRKTKLDRREIDKTRRILKKAAGKYKPKRKMKSRPFQQGSRKIPSRPFEKRAKT
jgi:5-methylcytosine-specific restriction protein A